MDFTDKYSGRSRNKADSMMLFSLLTIIRSEGRIFVFTGTQQVVF